MVLPVPLYELECGVNSYEWGKLGKDSYAAKLASASTELNVQPEKPYAELWMGTHPSLPSKDKASGRTLQDLVSTNESLLAPAVVSRFGTGQLPFLFKVLSIRKPLSIQAHPDKRLAERLHAEDPQNYPDDNHKPEMTIAITPFIGLCGFRPLSEIKTFLKTVPALVNLLGKTAIVDFEKETAANDEKANKLGLKKLFERLMKSDDESIRRAANDLVEAASQEGSNFAGGPQNWAGDNLAKLILNANKEFPSDIGLFCTFFLNYVELQPGEGMFLRANDPHAYISGDVIECMAASDNVVRAGFTPKYKDVETLTSMLTYAMAPPSEQKMNPTSYPFKKMTPETQAISLLYNPPIEEFAVIRIVLQTGSIQFTGIFGPSIALFTQGKGRIKAGAGGKKEVSIVAGTIVFIGAGVLIEIEGSDIVCFRAFCSVEEVQDSML